MTDLKASEARFRVALAGARTVVFEQDTSLRYTWFYNPLVPEGQPRQDARPVRSASDEAAVLAATKNRVLEQGESITEELDFTVENERRHYREAIEPMRDRAGKIVGIIGAATDITEQQATQRQLSRRRQLPGADDGRPRARSAQPAQRDHALGRPPVAPRRPFRGGPQATRSKSDARPIA